MSQFPEICAELVENPMANILANFRRRYARKGARSAFTMLFSSLAGYTDNITNYDDSMQLDTDLTSFANKISDDEIDLDKLQPLSLAITKNTDEIKIFDIAIDLARKVPYKPNYIHKIVRSTSAPSYSCETVKRNSREQISLDTRAANVEDALKNELDGNVIVGISNFWKVFFLDKEWSNQTLRMWKCYQSYEKSEIKIQEEDGLKSKIKAQVQKVLKEDLSEDISNKTRTQKKPKKFSRLETLEEGVPLQLSGGNLEQKSMDKDQDLEPPKEKKSVTIPKIIYENKVLIENMTEEEIWAWLDFFREKFLSQLSGPHSESSENFPSLETKAKDSKLRSKYCRTTQKNQMKGTTNNWQVDILIKSIEIECNTFHQWKDVRVLGGFTIYTSENKRKEKFLQMSRHALDVFSTQPLRRFLHGFLLFKTDFELWVFNRSGAYSTGLLSLKDNKDKLVRAISSYLLMSDQELGNDSTIQYDNGRSFVSFYDDKLKVDQVFDINPDPIFKAETLLSRGTVCYETCDNNAIVKYSWIRTSGKSEINFMQDANDTDGVIHYVRGDTICKISDHLSKLNFNSAKYWDLEALDDISKGEGAEEPTMKPCLRDRELTRVVVTPHGRGLRSSKTILEFLIGIRDAILGHQRLFVKKRLLHGDISDGNIILASIGGKLQGVLIDLDHAVKVEETSGKFENLFLTGTLKFMAIERLYHAAHGGKSITRTYYHDLESFFYVFLAGCIEYEDRPRSERLVLEDWYKVSVLQNLRAKESSMKNFKDEVLFHFSTNFLAMKDLAWNLRKTLFVSDNIIYRTPDDHEPVYRDIIRAFDETIDQIRDGRILNLEINKK